MELSDPGVAGTELDPLAEAESLARGAAETGVALRLIGGLAVRVLCPDFPPRVRRDQDMDFACLSKERARVVEYLEGAGCEADRRFNNLNGDRQMYFHAPSGRPIDVMVDRLSMCHTLDLRPGFGALPFTIGVADLLLTKLQIVELNAKDAHDIVHLLAAFPVGGAGSADGSGAIDRSRFERVLGADWGWWKTVTDNLAKLPSLMDRDPELAPPDPPHDPVETSRQLLEAAREAPKSLQWKLRAKVGERMRWYELPEEVDH